MADDPVRLSRVDRWVLSNQYKILERLVPQEADYYRSCREAVEYGYEREYERLVQHVFAEKDCLKDEECKEVRDILSMFQALKDAVRDGVDMSGIEPFQIQFAGFDGNNEGVQMSYARYYCSLDGGRFTGLEKGDDFNSHMPTLEQYRRQLAEWRKAKTSYQLTAEEVKRIAGAAIHPSMRDKK